MPLWLFVLLPIVAVGLGALISVTRRPGPVTTSAVQHFTAGVVFAAAAGEILPDLKHQGFWPVIMGWARRELCRERLDLRGLLRRAEVSAIRRAA